MCISTTSCWHVLPGSTPDVDRTYPLCTCSYCRQRWRWGQACHWQLFYLGAGCCSAGKSVCCLCMQLPSRALSAFEVDRLSLSAVPFSLHLAVPFCLALLSHRHKSHFPTGVSEAGPRQKICQSTDDGSGWSREMPVLWHFFSKADGGVFMGVTTSVDVKCHPIACLRVTHLPHLNSPFCWFRLHVLLEKICPCSRSWLHLHSDHGPDWSLSRTGGG